EKELIIEEVVPEVPRESRVDSDEEVCEDIHTKEEFESTEPAGIASSMAKIA
ncbi:hypothetical protein HAX54_027086, partial [Datura stramonium]|nr:hypothetical protein [Datura stramonium]